MAALTVRVLAMGVIVVATLASCSSGSSSTASRSATVTSSAAATASTTLTGGTGAGYQVPLLVAASGQRTVAVSLNQPNTPAEQRTRILTALATLALTNTG